MARLMYENRFILTRKLHREYYRSRYMKLKFRQIYFLGYRFREWLNWRDLLAQHGKAVVNIVKFNSDQVHVQVNATAFSFKYSTIESAFETDELIVLQLHKEGMAEHVQLLFKEGFVDKPRLEDFKEFIDHKAGRPVFGHDREDDDKQMRDKL